MKTNKAIKQVTPVGLLAFIFFSLISLTSALASQEQFNISNAIQQNQTTLWASAEEAFGFFSLENIIEFQKTCHKNTFLGKNIDQLARHNLIALKNQDETNAILYELAKDAAFTNNLSRGLMAGGLLPAGALLSVAGFNAVLGGLYFQSGYMLATGVIMVPTSGLSLVGSYNLITKRNQFARRAKESLSSYESLSILLSKDNCDLSPLLKNIDELTSMQIPDDGPWMYKIKNAVRLGGKSAEMTSNMYQLQALRSILLLAQGLQIENARSLPYNQ